MINYYILEIKGKNPKRILKEILKRKINVLEIKYKKDIIYLKVSYDDYKNIKKIKTSYEINIIKTSGKEKIYKDIRKYKTSIFFFLISILFIIFLSNITFFTEIETPNQELKKIIEKELKENNITIFSEKKDYKKIREITQKIKEKNSETIEWIEIENKGVITKIKVIERIKTQEKKDKEYKDIVASKNGYIRKIYSNQGEILKNIDDYVKKGETIISGTIYRNNKPISKVKAKGKVYAEVWYIVKANKEKEYIKLIEQEKGERKLVLKINNTNYDLIKLKSKVKNNEKTVFFSNKLFSLSYEKEKNYKKIKEKYSDQELIKVLETKAKKEILKTLEKEEYIMKQKTLKKTQEDGQIYLDIFFKVYEDIAKEENIKIIKEKED